MPCVQVDWKPHDPMVKILHRVFGATRTLSYRVFYFTLYSLGLRLSEGLALKVSDIDAARGRVHIRDSKGNRDRFVPLSDATLGVLRKFWQVHHHPELLFPNRAGGLAAAHRAPSPLDRGGVQNTLRQVVLDCGLKKRSPRTACATIPRSGICRVNCSCRLQQGPVDAICAAYSMASQPLEKGKQLVIGSEPANPPGLRLNFIQGGLFHFEICIEIDLRSLN